MVRPKLPDSERTVSISIRVKNWIYEELLKIHVHPSEVRKAIQEITENHTKEIIDKNV